MLIVILSRWWGPVGICGRIVGRIFLGSPHRTRHQAKMREECVTACAIKRRLMKLKAESGGADLQQLKVLLKDFFPIGEVSSRGS